MNLNEYPQAIASTQKLLLEQSQVTRKAKELLAMYDREIDLTIAFDDTLKNDLQRKSKRAELQADEEYRAALHEAQFAQDKETKLSIELELLRSEFSIAKLEKRESIALLELQANL